MSPESEKPKQEPRDPIFIGAEAGGAGRPGAAAGETPDPLAQFREMGAAGRDAGTK